MRAVGAHQAPRLEGQWFRVTPGSAPLLIDGAVVRPSTVLVAEGRDSGGVRLRVQIAIVPPAHDLHHVVPGDVVRLASAILMDCCEWLPDKVNIG